MGYESQFWVPRVISTIDEPQGAFTCRSSTVAVLADCGLFHGLLITVIWAINHRFGSPELFTPLTNPGCIYVSVINTRSFCRFWPVSWAINHRFGSPECFPPLTNPGRIYVPVINTRSFGRFWPVSWAINHSYMGY